MKNPLVATAEIAAFVEDMIAIPKALAFPDKPALYVLHDLILKGHNHHYLSHPEFLEGFTFGYECALDELEECVPESFTFGLIVQEVEIMLSHARHRRDNRMAKRLGKRCIHHSWNVGSAYGWLSALLDNGVVLRLPHTPAELQRRIVHSFQPLSCDDLVTLLN